MKTKYLFFGACMLAMPAAAQETYEIANLATPELNGTARYVGMGGAMESLGGDLSVISTNPAGIGVYRSNDAAVSFGFVSQQDAKKFGSYNKTNMSFDQVGFVYSMANGWKDGNRLNFAFNYHKSRNFDYILTAANSLSNASQNKLTYEKMADGIISSTKDYTCNMTDALYIKNLLLNTTDNKYYYYNSNQFDFNRGTEGYIGNYDFNISGSINNRVFLGLTVGLYDVHYTGYSEYYETVGKNADNLSNIGMADRRHITGTGVDIKAGIIFRPIADSPFRIGLSVSTPTYYDLTMNSSTQLSALGSGSSSNFVSGSNSCSYDYSFYTPWKFGVSMGHTVGNYLALGASYEYADYSNCDARIKDGDSYYDEYGGYDSNTSSDDAMNDHIGYTLKGVSTLKLGVEAKIDPSFCVRFGYNFVSPMYDKDGYKAPNISDPASYAMSNTDYVNWKSTNRITCGLGFRMQKFYLDLAYQYSMQKGDFYPFTSYQHGNGQTAEDDNICGSTSVDNNRHQVLMTLGYKF